MGDRCGAVWLVCGWKRGGGQREVLNWSGGRGGNRAAGGALPFGRSTKSGSHQPEGKQGTGQRPGQERKQRERGEGREGRRRRGEAKIPGRSAGHPQAPQRLSQRQVSSSHSSASFLSFHEGSKARLGLRRRAGCARLAAFPDGLPSARPGARRPPSLRRLRRSAQSGGWCGWCRGQRVAAGQGLSAVGS